MVKKFVYPKWFNEFWATLGMLKTRSLGNKYTAYQEALRVKVKDSDVPYLVSCFRRQTNAIRKANSSGKWAANHSDMDRWFKRRTFENWEEEVEMMGKMEQLQDRSWAHPSHKPFVSEEIDVTPVDERKQQMEGIKRLLG